MPTSDEFQNILSHHVADLEDRDATITEFKKVLLEVRDHCYTKQDMARCRELANRALFGKD